MDLLAMAFYATVCGVLGWAGPKLGRPPVRFGIGVIVGIIAVTVLPMVRSFLGG